MRKSATIYCDWTEVAPHDVVDTNRAIVWIKDADKLARIIKEQQPEVYARYLSSLVRRS